jgi:tRNA(Ser,Leu) C12 N-acetylase TAN1
MTEPEEGRETDGAEWNVLVTAQEGSARDLKRLINQHGAFRWSRFRNVLLGRVVDAEEFFRALAAQLEKKPFAVSWLGKALPICVTFPVHPESFIDDLAQRLSSLVEGLKGKSFHVRVERRGHKGDLRTHEIERQMGDYLWEELQRQGGQPVVSFKDPDVVVAVEIVGATAGVAVVARRLWQEFPFVKID